MSERDKVDIVVLSRDISRQIHISQKRFAEYNVSGKTPPANKQAARRLH